MQIRLVKYTIHEFELDENGNRLYHKDRILNQGEVEIQFRGEPPAIFASLDSIWDAAEKLMPEELLSPTLQIIQPREDSCDLWYIGWNPDLKHEPVMMFDLDSVMTDSDYEDPE